MEKILKSIKNTNKNPLGIIALFISMLYGVACLVIGVSINNFEGAWERLPLIYFVILFPKIILVVFYILVVYHHTKLYSPGDFKNEDNFVILRDQKNLYSKDLEQIVENLNDLGNKKSKGENIEDELNTISSKISRFKDKLFKIPLNNQWVLNHWGSNCASIFSNTMLFNGKSAPKGEDGSHIDIIDSLEIGKIYEISCSAKSSNTQTNGQLKLWCHDNVRRPDRYGSDVSTEFTTPSIEGDIYKVNFEARYNSNLRIHLQYKPGDGQIEVSEVKLKEING